MQFERGLDHQLCQLRTYYVYILSNQSRTLYVGVTNDLKRRLRQHEAKQIPGFTAKYNITWLIYYEQFNDVNFAIAREKQIKGWTRAKKIALAEAMNSRWEDLSAGWDVPA
jgi:putative endonuclease